MELLRRLLCLWVLYCTWSALEEEDNKQILNVSEIHIPIQRDKILSQSIYPHHLLDLFRCTIEPSHNLAECHNCQTNKVVFDDSSEPLPTSHLSLNVDEGTRELQVTFRMNDDEFCVYLEVIKTNVFCHHLWDAVDICSFFFLLCSVFHRWSY